MAKVHKQAQFKIHETHNGYAHLIITIIETSEKYFEYGFHDVGFSVQYGIGPDRLEGLSVSESIEKVKEMGGYSLSFGLTGNYEPAHPLGVNRLARALNTVRRVTRNAEKNAEANGHYMTGRNIPRELSYYLDAIGVDSVRYDAGNIHEKLEPGSRWDRLIELIEEVQEDIYLKVV